MKLISGWKSAHRFRSVQVCLGGIASGVVSGAAVYNSLADYWPPLITIAIATFVLLAVIVARVIDQTPQSPDDDTEHA